MQSFILAHEKDIYSELNFFLTIGHIVVKQITWPSQDIPRLSFAVGWHPSVKFHNTLQCFDHTPDKYFVDVTFTSVRVVETKLQVSMQRKLNWFPSEIYQVKVRELVEIIICHLCEKNKTCRNCRIRHTSILILRIPLYKLVYIQGQFQLRYGRMEWSHEMKSGSECHRSVFETKTLQFHAWLNDRTLSTACSVYRIERGNRNKLACNHEYY